MKKWIYSAALLPLFTASTLYAQTEDQMVAVEQGSYWQTIMMIGIAIVFFYFILWRPEQKRRKAMEAQRSSMKKGDRITAMGIVGTIIRVSPESPTVIIKMYDGSKIEMLKAAITDVHPGTDEDARKAEKEDASDSKKIESITKD